MIWRCATLLMVAGCGSDTITPGNQSFGDFSEWGDGIEGFTGSAGVVDTGGTTGAVTIYDGDYEGVYTLNIAEPSGQYTCTFSTVTFYVIVENGEMRTPSFGMTEAPNSCTFSNQSGSYTAKVDFWGTLNSDTTMTGGFSEDNNFFLEGEWTGYVITSPDDNSDGVPETEYRLSGAMSGNLASTTVPGFPVNLSGSFSLDKQQVWS